MKHSSGFTKTYKECVDAIMHLNSVQSRKKLIKHNTQESRTKTSTVTSWTTTSIRKA